MPIYTHYNFFWNTNSWKENIDCKRKLTVFGNNISRSLTLFTFKENKNTAIRISSRFKRSSHIFTLTIIQVCLLYFLFNKFPFNGLKFKATMCRNTRETNHEIFLNCCVTKRNYSRGKSLK